MKLRTNLNVELLSETGLEKMFQAALRVWRQVPFRIQGTDEFNDYLSAFGCQIDGELVRFPDAVIDKVLGRVRAAKQQWLEKNARQKPDWPPSEISMYTHGQALHVCDMETNQLRPATKADLVQWCHVVDALGDVGREHPTFIPTDAPSGASDFHTFATIILNSRRPYRVSVYSARMLPYFIDACTIAKGSLEEVKKYPVFAAKMWVNTPFMITRENVEIAMSARRLLGVPITPSTMPVAGAATPVTLAGAVTQTTAESLALNAISLAVDDRLVGISSAILVMDMKDASHLQAGPDVMIYRLAATQMNAHLFGGQIHLPGYNVAAQVVSPQSVYEKAMGTALGIMGGERSIGIGCLACSDIGSLVQLMLDYEMGLAFRNLFREVAIDDDRIGESTIVETAPRGAYYLDTDHTAKFFRDEIWLPAFLDHRNPLGWMNDPSDMIEKARARAREMVQTSENQCPLSEEQKREIEKLVTAADREAEGTGKR